MEGATVRSEWLIIGGLIIFFLALGGCAKVFGKTRLVEQKMDGLGTIKLPKTLEGPIVDMESGLIRCQFRRYYPWWDFTAMGSNTPIREELFVEIMSPEMSRTDRSPLGHWAIGGAAKGVKPANWRQLSWKEEQAGVKEEQLQLRKEDGLEVAEGIYSINMLKDPVVLVILESKEQNAVFAYRVWRRDASLQRAKQTVRQVAQSLVLAAPAAAR